MFDKLGVSFHSIEETMDTQSAMGRFFFTLTAALSHKRSRNEKTGGDIPYGYDLTPGGLLIKNEAEQTVIKTIRRLKRHGYSLRKICRELEREGYLTKTGNAKWHSQTVTNILKRHDKQGFQ